MKLSLDEPGFWMKVSWMKLSSLLAPSQTTSPLHTHGMKVVLDESLDEFFAIWMKVYLTQLRLAKIGQMFLAKVGLAKVDLSRRHRAEHRSGVNGHLTTTSRRLPSTAGTPTKSNTLTERTQCRELANDCKTSCGSHTNGRWEKCA